MIACCIICNLIGYTLVCETLPTQRRGLILGSLEIVICLGQLQNIVIMMFTHKNLEDGNISAFIVIMIIIMILTSITIYICIEESPRFLFFQDLYQEDFELKELINEKEFGNANHKNKDLTNYEKNKEYPSLDFMHENNNKEKLLQRFCPLEQDHSPLGSGLSVTLEKNGNESFLNNNQEKCDSEGQIRSIHKNENNRSLLKPYHTLLLKIISQNKSSYTLTPSIITELEQWGHKTQKDEINSEMGGNSWTPLFHGRYLTTTKVHKNSFCTP